jgi:TolB-like protein/Tfp pilus assembly protein PilF
MGPTLELRLFGGFGAATPAGCALDIVSKKNRALLAYLALAPSGSVPRDQLVALLWSDRDDEHARNSLRQALVALRRDLNGVGPSPLVVADDCVALDPSLVRVDAVEFARLAAGGGVQALREAMTLYRGDLLDGLAIFDPAFEEWVALERERLRDLAIATLERLWPQETAEQRIAVAKRLLSLDPLREAAHRALMQAYAEQGNAAVALRQYETCRGLLRRELDVAPAAETEELRRKILRKEVRPTASAESPQEPLALPEKPSIAVLPFSNLSNDPEQEYFADGLTDDIITGLSRVSALFVIAHASTLTYKGKAVDVQQIGRELGVRYVLEGSVRKAGNRVRITGQLVEAATRNHIWAEKYDRPLADFFDLQDEITQNVVASIQTQLVLSEGILAERRKTSNIRAWDLVKRAWRQLYELTPTSVVKSRQLAEQALTVDPTCAAAYQALSNAVTHHAYMMLSMDLGEAAALARDLALKAISLDEGDEYSHWAYANACFLLREHDAAIAALNRALEINPNCSLAHGVLGCELIYIGRPDEGIAYEEIAIRSNPRDPSIFFRYGEIAMGHFVAGRYVAAIEWANRAVQRKPSYYQGYVVAAASFSQSGDIYNARRAARRCIDLLPYATISRLALFEPLRDPADLERLRRALRVAGMPD